MWAPPSEDLPRVDDSVAHERLRCAAGLVRTAESCGPG